MQRFHVFSILGNEWEQVNYIVTKCVGDSKRFGGIVLQINYNGLKKQVVIKRLMTRHTKELKWRKCSHLPFQRQALN